MKLLFENWREYLNEDPEDQSGIKGLFTGMGNLGKIGLFKLYPAEAKELEKRGMVDRYIAAAKVADKEHSKLLDPAQYLRQPDELDAYLGLSQETPTPAPSSGGGKQAVTSNIQKMYDDLRTYDAKFQKNPEIRKKYEAALGAVNALLRSIS